MTCGRVRVQAGSPRFKWFQDLLMGTCLNCVRVPEVPISFSRPVKSTLTMLRTGYGARTSDVNPQPKGVSVPETEWLFECL